MDTTDPDIAFDEHGVCNHCHEYDRLVRERIPPPEEARRKLASIVVDIQKQGAGRKYDCIIGVSGGVDSTYIAKAVKELGLRPLAVHLDNGWDTEVAVSNISKALSKLGIDLHTHVIEWEEFKDIQRAFLLASTPDAEIPSDHAIFAILFQQATRIGVHYVITGLNVRTETHLPLAWSQGHWDWGYIRAIHQQFGSGRTRTFPHFNFYTYCTYNQHSHVILNLLDYIDYSKSEALKVLERDLEWKDYGGKHFESVYTRWFQGCYLPRKFGFDKRRCHLSSRVCSGELTREEAARALQPPPYPVDQQEADCEYVAKKLRLTADEFAAIMHAAPKNFHDYPSYAKWINGTAYGAARQIWRYLKFSVGKRPSAPKQSDMK